MESCLPASIQTILSAPVKTRRPPGEEAVMGLDFLNVLRAFFAEDHTHLFESDYFQSKPGFNSINYGKQVANGYMQLGRRSAVR